MLLDCLEMTLIVKWLKVIILSILKQKLNAEHDLKEAKMPTLLARLFTYDNHGDEIQIITPWPSQKTIYSQKNRDKVLVNSLFSQIIRVRSTTAKKTYPCFWHHLLDDKTKKSFNINPYLWTIDFRHTHPKPQVYIWTAAYFPVHTIKISSI